MNDAHSSPDLSAPTDELDAGLGRKKPSVNVPQQQQQRGPSPSVQGLAADISLEYSMRYPRRGYCLIFNQVHFKSETKQSERVGSDVDADSLERTFRRLLFDVVPFRDLTCAQIITVVRDYSRRNHTLCDCIAVVILSHGEDGCVYGTDGRLSLDGLASLLRPDQCHTLANKPKLFFIQACRGYQFDKGFESTDGDKAGASAAAGKVSRVPLESDFLYFYSTPPGYYSWRNDQQGSWFVQQLCRVLDEHGDGGVELGHMLLLVQRLVASEHQSSTNEARTTGMKQIPVTVSTLRKLLYFRRKSD